MKKVNILNLNINNTTFTEALESVIVYAKQRKPSYACFVNAHMTVEANSDSYMLEVVNSADFAFADGAPVAKSFQILHGINQTRIAGMDFFPLMLKKAEQHKLNVSIIGSTNEILSKTREKIEKQFPNLNITNLISPPFDSPWDNNDYVNRINQSNTNILFVALGCPKQEKWMHKHKLKVNAVMLGIGGALPVYANVVKRAPAWMQNNGLEWLYRLIKEPRRMWKRYLVTNTIFIKLLLFKRLFNA